MRESRPPLDATFFQTVDARGIAISAQLRNYFRRFLGIDPTPTALRDLRMEEVFADVFYDFRETPSDTTRNAYIDLVDLYLRVLRETTNWLCAPGRSGAPVGRLLAAAANASEELTVITFNHDLVIENEINRRARLRERWCLDQGYGSLSSSLSLLFPQGSSPLFQLHRDGGCDHTKPLTLLKLHGSLNWVVRINSARPTANTLSGGGAGATGALQLLSPRQLVGREIFVRLGGPGRTQWTLWPVVVPPIYEKQAVRADELRTVWSDARAALERADRVLFFGYSLPALDIEAEKTFDRALIQNQQLEWMDVVDPSPATAARFGEIAPTRPLRWYPSLTEFLNTDGFS